MKKNIQHTVCLFIDVGNVLVSKKKLLMTGTVVVLLQDERVNSMDSNIENAL